MSRLFMLFGNKWKATPMHLWTRLLSSVTKQCQNFSAESNAILATLNSSPFCHGPLINAILGLPREGARWVPAELPSSKRLLTPLTPAHLLFYGPSLNLHGANHSICTTNLDRAVESMSKLVSFNCQTSDQQSSWKQDLKSSPPTQRTERPLNAGFAECLIQPGKSHPLLTLLSLPRAMKLSSSTGTLGHIIVHLS